MVNIEEYSKVCEEGQKIDESLYGNLKERWTFATKLEEEYGNAERRNDPTYLGAGYSNIPWVRWKEDGYADRANLLSQTFIKIYRKNPNIKVKEVVEILENRIGKDKF